jgi:hypothetical protein
VTMKNTVFWDVAQCRSCVSHLLTLVPRSLIFLPWRWRRYVPPKRRFTQYLYGATSQKTAFFNFSQSHQVYTVVCESLLSVGGSTRSMMQNSFARECITFQARREILTHFSRSCARRAWCV